MGQCFLFYFILLLVDSIDLERLLRRGDGMRDLFAILPTDGEITGLDIDVIVPNTFSLTR